MGTLEQFEVLSSIAVAFLLAASTIPFAKRIAVRLGAVALPNNEVPAREPIPALAGAPIIVAIIASLALFSAVPLWMTVGAVSLMAVGLVDDILALRPATKLTLQAIIVAGVVVRWQVPMLFPSSALNAVLAMLWLLATINAFNLIDGLDGLAGGVGIAIALAVSALGAIHNDMTIVCEGLAVAGALGGFLLFNFSPASIFMGDCGALPLGFLLGAMALDTANVAASSKLMLFVLPALLMLVPLLDMGVVSISRMATNRPVTRRGHDHSHHKLLALGLPGRTASEVCWVIAAFSGLCAIALASMSYANAVVALPIVAAVFGLIAFFMIDLTFDSAEAGETYRDLQGVARVLLHFGYKRRITEVLLDIVLISAAYLGSFLIRFDFVVTTTQIESIVPNLPYVIAVSLAAFFAAGIYRGIWRCAGLVDIPRFAYAALCAGVAVVIEAYFVRIMLSGSIAVLFVLLLFNLLAASRLSFKGFRVAIARVAPPHRRVLVVGSGPTGEAAVRFVENGPHRGARVVGLVDSDPFKIGSRVYGSVVLGTVGDLTEIHATTLFNEIFLACDSIAPEHLERLLEFARAREVPLLRFSIELNEIARPLLGGTTQGIASSLPDIVTQEKVIA